MKLHKHSISKISLNDVLRKRKLTLSHFLHETGIVTYSLLLARCKSMGVNSPTIEQFNLAMGLKSNDTPKLSSPTEGVIVLQPPDIILESTGKIEKIDEQETTNYFPPSYPKKKKKLDRSQDLFSLRKEKNLKRSIIINDNDSNDDVQKVEKD